MRKNSNFIFFLLIILSYQFKRSLRNTMLFVLYVGGVLGWVMLVECLSGLRVTVSDVGIVLVWVTCQRWWRRLRVSVGYVGGVLGWRARTFGIGSVPVGLRWVVCQRGWCGWCTKVSNVDDIEENTSMVY